MKRLLNRSFMLLALLGVLFTSCKKDHYDEPPIQDLPVGQVYTIDQILALESGFVFNEDASVYGTITADEVSGNLYKAAFMQDPETGKAIELYLNATSGVRIGDRVRIYLKGVTYALYNGLPQLSNFEPDGHIIIEANNQPIQPLETTIAEICSGSIVPGSLVKLKHVKFTEKNTFADPTTYGNRTLVDSADYTKQVTVRTSNYANFANDSLPQGNGEMIAIASIYNSTWQLLIRSARELKFDGYTPSADGLPYYQDFASSFGTYSTYNVAGNQEWVIDYSTAKMTGYENSTNYANEDWLISSRFSLENVSSASLTMSYIARYFNNLNSDITIQVSSDYISGDPTLATWTAVPANWTSGSDWSTFASTVVDLSQFVGQKVTVAVKYLSDDVKAGTIEVKSILIQEGSGPTPPGPTPGEVQTMPYSQDFSSEFGTYTTFDALGSESWIIDYQTAKMTGYENNTNHANEDWLISSPVAITGVSDAKMSISYIARYFNNLSSDITFWASENYTSGTDPATATWSPIDATLTAGSNWTDFVTTDISLSQFVGQTVTVAVKYVSTDAKAGTIEIKNITIQEGSGPTPPGPTPGGDVQAMPYTQNFSTSFGTYTTFDVAGSQSWSIDYSTAKMTGYVNPTNYANEDWLISSPVAITGVSSAMFSMTYIARYFNSLDNDITLWASSNYVYGSNPTTATWTQVSASWTAGNDWNNFKTTDVSLESYVGQTVTFAVKYLSTDSKAGTIEIQSITISEGTAPTPPTPPTPGGSGTASDPYNVGSGITLQGQDVVAWVQGYIVGAVKSGLSSVSSNADVNWAAPFDLATNVLIADDPTCKEVSSCVIVNLPSGKPLRSQVNLMDNPGNLGKLLAVNGKLRTYFGQAGLRDSGGTTNDFVLEGGSTPPTPPTPPQGIFSETFATDQGSFNIVDVNLPQGLNYVWSHYDNANCMKGSAFYQQAYAAESWLVSPQIDLSDVSEAKVTFEHAVNYNTDPQSALTVMVSTNYNGNVVSASWSPLTLSEWPDGESWTFITATASLDQYAGQKITIAFKYTSTSSTASTWEIRNLVVE